MRTGNTAQTNYRGWLQMLESGSAAVKLGFESRSEYENSAEIEVEPPAGKKLDRARTAQRFDGRSHLRLACGIMHLFGSRHK